MNQEAKRVTADGRTVQDIDAQAQKDALIEAMANLGRRLSPDFDKERFKRAAGYVGTLITQ